LGVTVTLVGILALLSIRELPFETVRAIIEVATILVER